jgi:hypothetical protein
MPFIGKNPTSGFSTIVKDDLTPDGSTTAFTLSKNVASANDIAVFVGNVRQEPTDAYSVSGTTLTMTAAPASGVNFYVLHIAGTVESSVVPAAGTTVPGAFGVSGNLDVDGTFNVSDDLKFTGGATPTLGVGTITPNRKFVVYGNNASGAEISLTNTDMTADKRTMNFFMSGDKAHMRILNDAGTAGTNAIEFTSEGYVTKPNQPIMQASNGPNIRAVTGTATAATVVIYSYAGVNNGNYYSTSTGLFTCPVAGWYRVFQHMMVDTAGVSESLNVQLIKNGAAWLSSYTNNVGYEMNVSQGIIYCSANDTLGVRVGHGGKHAGYDSFNIELIG